MTPTPSVSLLLLRPGARPSVFSLAATQVDAESAGRPVAGADGTALPAGCAIELGYFSKGTLARPFSGTWTPLIGPQAAGGNAAIPLIKSGAGGEPAGRFRWCRAFYAETDEQPPAGTPLALRFYDHADPARAGHYNTASHPSWWFKTPRSPSPSHVEANLISDAVWESGPLGAFRTVLPNTNPLLRFFSSHFGRFSRHAAAAVAL
jgi:hypothetical protein